MESVDARRLTGPNVLMDPPGAIVDVACSEEQSDAVLACWTDAIRRMLTDIGWTDSALYYRKLVGGLSLAFTGPIDALYAATAVNEWAFEVCAAMLSGNPPPDYAQSLDEIRTAVAEEANPSLIALQEAALRHNVTLLWDDDEVSLGMGASALTYSADELPAPDEVDFSQFSDVPIGLITGTNGKTTTVRLVRHIAMQAGLTPGLSSTDWIAVGNDIIDSGDWSGPGGARTVLRRKEVDIGILETARGGLLRRGLAVERAEAAVITNIAEDHLGDFGSRNLDELLDIKWVVSRAVRADGALVLNADDALLVERARVYDGRIVWFSLEDDNKVVQRHVDNGGTAFVVRDHDLQRLDATQRTTICRDEDIPITLGGAARHNVANALAAAALCDALGISTDAIASGLRSMSQDANPGRCNVYTLPNCRVLVDFAHNPHAMQALFDMARALPAKRRILAFGQAGDRTDEQIRELAASAWAIGLDHVIVSELEKYHRGREPNEVFGLIRDALLDSGAERSQIEHHQLETESLAAALSRATDGDLIIMLALADGDEIRAQLQSLAVETA